MCIPTVIDASAFGDVLHSPAGADLNAWIMRGDGRIVYSNRGRYWNELARSKQMLDLMREYRRANPARLVAADLMRVAEESLTDVTTRSGARDKPVLALAMASGALVLYSTDQDLIADFLDTRLLPRVNRRKRAVYPTNQASAVRRRFLMQRRCPDRQCP